MTILIIFFVLLVLVFLFWYYGRQPKIHEVSQDDLRKYIEVLLYRGYDKGFMIIQVPFDKKFKRFLQFAKHIGGKNEVGLEFGYPLATWSEPYYEKLKHLLLKNKIQFEIEKTGEEMVVEFLLIDVGQNVEKAAKICKLVLQDLYGLNQNDLIQLYFVNVSEKVEKIGF